jgi:RHS repeat-associated protein
VDDTGAVKEWNSYDVYGKTTVHTNAGNDSTWFTDDDGTAAASSKGNPYGFTGRRYETYDSGNLALYYYRTRYYSPGLGRFLQRDPIAYVDGMNLYEYVESRPVTDVDPSGLSVVTPSWFPGHFDPYDPANWPRKDPNRLPRYPNPHAPPKLPAGVPDCQFHLGLDPETWREAVESYAVNLQKAAFPGEPDPYQGGYRHCVAACCLHKRLGTILGRVAIWYYDLDDPDVEDHEAERTGYGLGGDPTRTCGESCKDPYPPRCPAWKK